MLHFYLGDNLQILQETVFLRISSHSLTEEILNGTLHFSIFVQCIIISLFKGYKMPKLVRLFKISYKVKKNISFKIHPGKIL